MLMKQGRVLKNILSFDQEGIHEWLRARLSGLPTTPTAEISRGEEPEDLIVYLYKLGDEGFRQRVRGALTRLIEGLLPAGAPQGKAPLLAGLAYLVDMLDVKEAAPLLLSFLFREDLRDMRTSHGDLQEQILRCILAVAPKQFDSRFWELEAEQPRFSAVGIRGLAEVDPRKAVRKLGRLVEFVVSGNSEANAKVVLWRLSKALPHREFLDALRDSLHLYGGAVVHELRRLVDELPFDSAAKKEFLARTESLHASVFEKHRVAKHRAYERGFSSPFWASLQAGTSLKIGHYIQGSGHPLAMSCKIHLHSETGLDEVQEHFKIKPGTGRVARLYVAASFKTPDSSLTFSIYRVKVEKSRSAFQGGSYFHEQLASTSDQLIKEAECLEGGWPG